MTGRVLRVGRAEYPVLLPSARDPRLHLAATITSLHVIGQVWLHFELSIAQILLAVGTSALLEVAFVLAERRVIAWPASAMLTGNGVAFVLRVNGTHHGDWWSLNGWYIYVATAALGLLSKYALRRGDRPMFNPSNLALVACFLILGTTRVNPLDFWWGPMSAPMVGVLVVLLLGALVVTRRVGMLGLAVSCWACLAAGLAVPAAIGHAMRARWSLGPVTDWTWWRIVVTSPEVIVFLFFMITDPKTTPRSRRGRVGFGFAVGLVAALMIAPTRTEFWAKVALLSALVVVHTARWLADLVSAPDARERRWPVVVAAAVLVATLPAASWASREPLPVAGPAGAPPPGHGALPVLPAVVVPAKIVSLSGGLGQDVGGQLRSALAHFLAGTQPGITALTVVVVRDPNDPQAVPRLGLLARGGAGDSVYVFAPAASGYVVVGRESPAQAGVH